MKLLLVLMFCVSTMPALDYALAGPIVADWPEIQPYYRGEWFDEKTGDLVLTVGMNDVTIGKDTYKASRINEIGVGKNEGDPNIQAARVGNQIAAQKGLRLELDKPTPFQVYLIEGRGLSKIVVFCVNNKMEPSRVVTTTKKQNP